MVELTLFEKYSIDTNVIVSFLGDGDAGLYPVDVFGPQWDFLEAAFKDGRVVAAKRVATELKKWERLDRMKMAARSQARVPGHRERRAAHCRQGYAVHHSAGLHSAPRIT